MVVYDSCAIYVEGAKTLNDRLARVDAVLSALETTALRSAGNEDLTSYLLDNGQTKIQTMYRDSASLAKAILAFEQIRERIISKLNKSRVSRLVDQRNLIGPRGFR